ncbi:MAG: hypothetical protein WB615_01450 [Candidatus Tumulicola sp.]
MVTHAVTTLGVDLKGNTSATPTLLQLNAEDFPARFLQDLLTQSSPVPISSTVFVDPSLQPLYQPVQRVLHLALAELSCYAVGNPRLDPTRVVSAGLVIRRASRSGGVDDANVLQAWMRSPAGQFQWTNLDATTDWLDPDPAKRPQLYSGSAELDRQLAAIALSMASTETTSPVFVAPPATCAALGRTIAYGVIPTASADTSDGSPGNAVTYTAADVAKNLPPLLQAGTQVAPLPGTVVDCRWMSDEFLNAQFPPPSPGQSNPGVAQFQIFATTLRMLKTVFGTFDPTPEGRAILAALNDFNVYTSADSSQSQPMGEFYRGASAALIDYNPADDGAPAPQITLPFAYDALGASEPTGVATSLLAALVPRTQAMLLPQGRYQDASRYYCLRMFFRIKSEHPNCPPQLIWSEYSAPFRIAAWFENSSRAHPPVPLPDPTDRNFLKSLKPNCSFVVPGGLMGAMQGSSMSGLMNGAGGGPKLTLGWLCSFNIPLITICAFFVLNIFLTLLNIVFFWLPMIKICIPFPEEE